LQSSRTVELMLANTLLSLWNDGKIISDKDGGRAHTAASREINMQKFAIPALIAVASLASCTTERERPLPEVAPTPATIEGTWTDPNGLLSTFQAGNFNTRTTDTNQLLASGTYVKGVGANIYEISMVSHVQNKQSKVNCAMVNPQQLNCTADSGAQFSLTRKSTTVATQ
jgi:hypothetical protein